MIEKKTDHFLGSHLITSLRVDSSPGGFLNSSRLTWETISIFYLLKHLATSDCLRLDGMHRVWADASSVDSHALTCLPFSTPPSLPAHFIIHTLAFTDNPRCGGWGVEGWPLLIQRLGICIWLLFVNQWCDRAGRGVSPRLSLRLARRCGLPVRTQLHAKAECEDIMQSHETNLILADQHTNHLPSSPFWCFCLFV